jgi:hypothetical protein
VPKDKARTDMAAVRRAAANLHRGMQLVAEARRSLAHLTRCGAPPAVVARDLQWAHSLLQSRAAALHDYPGVIGYGLGRAIKGRTMTGERCITVFVGKKLSLAELKRRRRKTLPRSIGRKGKRIRVDVVEIGELTRSSFVGASVGPTNDPHHEEGTIGAFARDGVDNSNVAITAMHVSGLRSFPNGGPAPSFSVPSTRRQDPNMKSLGLLTFGTMDGVDAAKIAVQDPDDVSQDIPTLGAVAGWRPLANPGDEDVAFVMYGAVSGLVNARILHTEVSLPQFQLNSAIVVDVVSQRGDSGAPLLDGSNHIVGFLVGQLDGGQYAGKSIFCPAAAVVDALNCDF